MIFSIPSNYFLSSYALTLTLNAMSLPDYMQASAASGARIMVYMKVDKIDNPNSDATITAENALIDTLNIDLGYDVDLNYRAWTINLVPTYFTNTAEKYIYAAIPRGSSNATTAMIVFPSNKIDVFGRMEQTMIINNQEVTKVVQVGSADYYYIWLYGEISPSVDGTGASQNRVFITDVQNNLLSPYNSGALDTKKSQTEGLVDDLSERFLSKIKDDSTPYNLNIGKDLKVGGNSTVDGNSTVSKDSIVNGNQTVGGNESVSGYATIGGDVTIGGKSTITGDNSVGGNSIITGDNTVGGKQVIKGELSSSNFNSDNQAGFAIEKKDSNHYKISITDIEIWGKATFNVLEVRKLISIGGNFMFSPSSGKILLVQNFSTFYRCYLLADDGTTATTNNFKVGDNVLCETFNIAEGVYSNVSNKRYWRTIVDVSTVSEIIYDKGMIYWNQIDDDHIVYDENNNPVTYISKEPIVQNKKFYWIDLSKTLCEEGSDIPEAGDEIATFGNINDITRQNSIYIVCEGESSPAIKFYKGVNSFDLTNKKPILISPDRFEVLSDIFTLRTSNGRTISIANYKGVWTEGTVAYYGEQYSYDGRIWECVNKTYGITTAPFLGEDWNIVVDKGEKGDTGNDGIAGKDGVGISSTTITYQIGDSGTTAPTGTWSSTVPTAIPGKYLWTRTVWTYTDSTNETGYSVSKYGEKGDTGSSVYLLDLTNENSSVTCDKSGNVIGILQGTTAYLYYGSSIVSGVVYSAVFTGCSGSINASTGVVTISGLSSNTGTVTIIATHSSGYLTAIYTITKVYAGADGSNAVTYYIMPSVSSIQKDNDTLTPSTITCSKYKQIGGQTPVITTEKTLKYKQSNDNSETTYSGSITISSSATYIDFILYDTDGTTILDKERIPVIQNGINGTGAWNIIMSCSSIIFTQALDKSINISGNKSYFSLFYQGVLDTIDHVEIITQNNCSASILQDTSGYYLQINSISLDTNNNYYTNGYVVINIGKNGIHTENVRFNWALNALGTFKEQIINDTDTRYASKTEFNSLSNNTVTKTVFESTITQTSKSILAEVNSKEYIQTFGLTVYGNVIKDNYYKFSISQSGDFAAICSILTGLIIGNKYVIKITIKNIDCVDGATLDNYISTYPPSLSLYGDAEDYQVTDYNEGGDIYIEFIATSNIIYAGLITGSDGWTNNTGGYCNIDIQNISLFSEDMFNSLLATGINIQLHKIIATSDSFLIKDNSGNINTVFETVNGFPMVRSKIIQADKIVATKIKTSDFGTRTEVINDMISQYNDLGELAVRIHGGSLNTSSGEVAIGSIAPRVIDRTINASNGLIQEFDISLTANDTFEVTSLMNTIKVYDSDSIINVPIDCAITCNNVKSIGYELYVSDIAGDNMSGAYIFSENPSTGTLNLTKGMSGTVVLTSSIARTGCKIYVHFIIEFNNSSGSLVIRNTNLEDGNESIFNVKIKYGGNVTEMAKDGFLTCFGNYGFKISSSGIQKSVDGGTTWNPI